MTYLKKKLGARIQKIRKMREYTQEFLAEKIGMDKPNLNNIECGRRFMKAETLEKIAAALNVTERELFDFNEIEPERYVKTNLEELLTKSDEDDLIFYYSIISSYLKRKNKKE